MVGDCSHRRVTRGSRSATRDTWSMGTHLASGLMRTPRYWLTLAGRIGTATAHCGVHAQAWLSSSCLRISSEVCPRSRLIWTNSNRLHLWTNVIGVEPV